MKRFRYVGASGLAFLVVVGIGVAALNRSAEAQGAPAYRVVPLWPQPFRDDSWVIGSITGVATDAQNNVWVVHRGNASLEGNEKGMLNIPPAAAASSSVCCISAPVVLQFDAAGKLLQGWGGPSSTYKWPETPGGITVDAKGNVWIAAAGEDAAPVVAGRGRGAAPAAAGRGRGDAPAPPPPPPGDAHVLKFSNDGRYLMTIGTPGKMDGPDSQTTLNRPAATAYDAAANEIYVADSGNHRIVVFDADKGTYKRHWGAYGEKPTAEGGGPYSASGAASRQFRDVTCVEIARDGNVYVCDRSSNRIQVFDKTGKFIREGVIAKNTMGATVSLGGGAAGVVSAHGSVYDIAFSNDAAQRYIFVADGTNKKVRVVQRDNLTEVGTIGNGGGRYPGQFLVVDAVASDAQGNVYTGENHHGKRVQKFVPGR
jgi:DNA-binding beta-propeller fold protein YncE